MNAGFRLFALVLTTQLSACGIGYYFKATAGHLELMRLRQPVDQVLADPETSPQLVQFLEQASASLAFAHSGLLLPDNGSYRQYSNLDRPFAVWNVIAASEFSLEPETWCFPVAGCVAYRGYFREEYARTFAAELAGEGMDIFVGGATAYSTLGRFSDPLLNTMVGLPASRLTGLIFHELAHQQLYVKGDTKFNEGFASFVEREGLRRWTGSRIGSGPALASAQCALAVRNQRRTKVLEILDRGRRQLGELYAGDFADTDRRDRKAAIFTGMISQYLVLRDQWSQPPYFDGWFDPRLNNAKLAALGVYDDYVPAFEAMLAEAEGDLQAFYHQADQVAGLPRLERDAEMARLLSEAVSNSGAKHARPLAETCPDQTGN